MVFCVVCVSCLVYHACMCVLSDLKSLFYIIIKNTRLIRKLVNTCKYKNKMRESVPYNSIEIGYLIGLCKIFTYFRVYTLK